ncbi:MAG: DUF2911 domain-containing protein [Acidobacteriota bacterium]
MKRVPALVVLSVTLLASAAALAQTPAPPQSPAGSANGTSGAAKITIEYHRPSVRGREIWGGLVPYGQVWRLGANEATTIAFSAPVKIEGKDVPAGTYALFAIPGKDKWTFIVNKNAKQWGAFKYQQTEDLLRFDVVPQAGNAVEMMTFSVVSKAPASASVEMEWAKVKTSFSVTGSAAK